MEYNSKEKEKEKIIIFKYKSLLVSSGHDA